MQPIKKERVVAASQAIAFDVFTNKMDAWWPKTHHIGKAPMTELILEPKTNGRWFSKHEDGSEANVGYVMEYDPYSLLVLAWQVNGNFEFDPELITEVEVQFIAEGPATTRVLMEHRNLDKLGGGTKVVESMDGGWGMILDLYKSIAEKI